jgi:hypothetical protein
VAAPGAAVRLLVIVIVNDGFRRANTWARAGFAVMSGPRRRKPAAPAPRAVTVGTTRPRSHVQLLPQPAIPEDTTHAALGFRCGASL